MDAAEIIETAKDLLARERAAEALEAVAPALARDPDNIALLMIMAEVLTELDRPADATAAWRGVLALDPDHALARAKVEEATAAMETLLRLASIADDLRAWDEARENYEAVLHQDPCALMALTRLLTLDGFDDLGGVHGPVISPFSAMARAFPLGYRR
jgi:tetratricopeptide (TPR) repeat protein